MRASSRFFRDHRWLNASGCCSRRSGSVTSRAMAILAHWEHGSVTRYFVVGCYFTEGRASPCFRHRVSALCGYRRRQIVRFCPLRRIRTDCVTSTTEEGTTASKGNLQLRFERGEDSMVVASSVHLRHDRIRENANVFNLNLHPVTRFDEHRRLAGRPDSRRRSCKKEVSRMQRDQR